MIQTTPHFILDLLPSTCTEVISQIYNINSDSPTTISLYYQINIKQNPLANEIDTTIDLINTKDIELINKKLPFILESIQKKVEDLKKYIDRNIKNFETVDKEEAYLLSELILMFQNMLSRIIITPQSVYFERRNSKIEFITIDEDIKIGNLNILEILSNSFNQIKISTWNMYNAIKSEDDKPYIVEDKLDFLRKLENLLPIDYFLSDYLNYRVTEKEFIEWLFAEIEIDILSTLEYIQEEKLESLKENISNIITEILNSLDEFSKIKELYIEFRQTYEQLKLMKLRTQLKCPVCGNNILDNECKKCKIFFIDLITNIPFLKTLFQTAIIRDQKLFKELIDITINGIKKSINLEDSNFLKIIEKIDKISIQQNIHNYFKLRLSSVKIIEEILEKLEELKKCDIEEIRRISSILLDIHLNFEKISLSIEQ